MSPLDTHTVVILGGAGLLGRAFSKACVAAGAQVIIVDTSLAGRTYAEAIGADFLRADITSEKSLATLTTAITRHYKKIDGLVHAAYPKTKRYGAPIKKAATRDMLKNIEMQLGSPLLATQAFMPLLSKNASVIFLASIYGVAAPRFEIYKGTAMTMPVEYAAAKGGIIALVRYFASLLGSRGIRVNAISPGGILDKQPKSFIHAYSKKTLIPPGLLAPEDIAGAVLFLLSDASRKMTGQNLVVDGGWTL